LKAYIFYIYALKTLPAKKKMDVFTQSELNNNNKTREETDTESLTQNDESSKRYVTSLFDTIATHVYQKNGGGIGGESVLKKEDITLVIRTWSVLVVYQLLTLVLAWTAYRHDWGRDDDNNLRHGLVVASIFTGVVSTLLIFILCAVKSRQKACEGFLILFLIVFSLFLIFMTAATDSDVIPRLLVTGTSTAFITMIAATISSNSKLCLSSLANLCLLWTIGLHTLLVASSPDVARRTHIETTLQDFTLALLLVSYQLLQLRYISRFSDNRSIKAVLLGFVIDIPLYIINMIIACVTCCFCRK